MSTLFIKIKLNKQYAEWKKGFDKHKSARKEMGVEDLLVAQVLTEQSAMIVLKTDKPEQILDMMYEPETMKLISDTGHIIGEEAVTICA